MSKHKHTEGKWLTENGLMVRSEDGTYVGYLEDFSDADVARVIACVNACKNLRNEQLNDLIQLGGISLNMLDSVMKERDEYKRLLENHGPEGHNVTNQQFVELRRELAAFRERIERIEEDDSEKTDTPDFVLADVCQLNVEYRTRLTALEELATALEADIDCGRPLEYTVEVLRDELIRTREVLGMLPEQRINKR